VAFIYLKVKSAKCLCLLPVVLVLVLRIFVLFTSLCNGSVIALAKGKSKLIMVSKVPYRLPENNTLIKEQDLCQSASVNFRLPKILCQSADPR